MVYAAGTGTEVFMHIDQRSFTPDLRKSAILLDVDGTIVDIAPTPESIDVPASLRHALARLIERTGGARWAARPPDPPGRRGSTTSSSAGSPPSRARACGSKTRATRSRCTIGRLPSRSR